MADPTPTALRASMEHCLAAAGLGVTTAARIRPTAERAIAFMEQAGAPSLTDVSAEHARDFVVSRLNSGLPAALATQHNRRAVLRLIFRVARRFDPVLGDPTLDLWLPGATSLPTRPLDDDEVELCRDVAWWASSRIAAAWALAEASARGAEMALVEDADIDFVRGTVVLSGGARTAARTGVLTEWGANALQRRVRETEGGPITYSGEGRGNAGQVSTCRAISTVLVRAGLAGEPDVRPASVAGWAGRRVFESSGSIEDAARAMGVRSLDRAARLIGLDWADRG